MKKFQRYDNANIEYINSFVEDSLLHQKEDFYPVFYYNSERPQLYSPEYIATNGVTTKKSSRLIALPNPSNKEYFACVIYARKKDFSRLNSIVGYSAYQAKVKSNGFDVHNCFKLNYFGERRLPNEVPLVLLSTDHFSSSEIDGFITKLKADYGTDASFYTVWREIDGKSAEFFEINCDVSNFYSEYGDYNYRDILYRHIAYDILCYFKDYDHIYLTQADGQNFCDAPQNIDMIQKLLDKKVRQKYTPENEFVRYFLSKGFCTNLVVAESPKKDTNKFPINNLPAIRVNTMAEQIDLVKYDDESTRTVLFYLDRYKKRKGLSIAKELDKIYPDNKEKIVRVARQTEAPMYAKGIAINRQDDIEFSHITPLLYNKWQKLGVLSFVKELYYINVHNELCDCTQTPFAVVGTDNKDEVSNLLSDLSKRYNYQFRSRPVVRTVDSQSRDGFELSLSWYSNSNFRYYKPNEFREATMTTLENINNDMQEYSDQQGIEHHEVYTNGALK